MNNDIGRAGLEQGKEYALLRSVDSPEKLRTLSRDQKEQLAREVRSFLIESVSRTGGHLASNLGAVELTIAVHSVFDSDNEIVWDVGHQSYVHKMLTGRLSEMKDLRQRGGISGFPKRKESAYDAFDTGHSSTSISAAVGIAAAKKLRGKKGSVLVIIGDGALTGGMAYEALNHLGNSKDDVKIVLNDNQMSISENVGGIVNSLRASAGYSRIKKSARSFLDSIPLIGKPIKRGIRAIKRAFRTFFIGGGQVFEELGIKYLGGVDGHDIKKLERALSKLREYEGPALLHVYTIKGKGYEPAEKNPELYHGVGTFDAEKGVEIRPEQLDCKLAEDMPPKNFSDAFGKKLTELASEHDNVVAITAAMLDGTGLKCFAERFPQRTFDVGIAEQHAVTLSAGMALNGLKPYVAIYSTFLQRAYDQVLHDVCLQNAGVVFCIDRAGLVGADGETHQGIFDISFLSPIPGITIFSVANYDQLRRAMELSYKIRGPVAIRYPRGGEVLRPNNGGARVIDELPGEAIKIHDRADYKMPKNAAIIATCRALEPAIRASAMLKEKYGVELPVYNISQIHPLSESVLEMLGGLDIAFTVEDHILTGGFGDLVEDAGRASKVVKFGLSSFVPHGSVDELYEDFGLSASQICEEMASYLMGLK